MTCDGAGFIIVDDGFRVRDTEEVFAVGDGAAGAYKQGGLSAQQADAVAEQIAWRAGAEHPPRPYRPVLRALLRTVNGPRYLRADPPGGSGEAEVSDAVPLVAAEQGRSPVADALARGPRARGAAAATAAPARDRRHQPHGRAMTRTSVISRRSSAAPPRCPSGGAGRPSRAMSAGPDPLVVRPAGPATLDRAAFVAVDGCGTIVGRATLSRMYGSRGELQLELARTGTVALALVEAIERAARERGLAQLELNASETGDSLVEALRHARPAREEQFGSDVWMTWPTTPPRS